MTQIRKITEEGVELYRNMVDGMLAIDHQTAWMHEPKKLLIFTSIDPNTVEKATRVLQEAGLLCDTAFGDYGSATFIKELSVEENYRRNIGHDADAPTKSTQRRKEVIDRLSRSLNDDGANKAN